MLTDVGFYAVIFAFVVLVYAAGSSVLGARRNDDRLVQSGRTAASLAFPLMLIGVAGIWAALLNNDYGVKYVASVSSRATPLFFRLTALWSAQNGSLLFWCLIMSVFVFFAMRRPWREDKSLLPYVTATMALVLAFFIGLTLAIACNLNTLQIVRGLSMDDKLRASFSERAIQAVQNADATATPPAGTTSPTEVSKEAARKQLNDALNEFAEAGFPIGWNRQTAAAWVESPITLFFSSILGWLLAAVAAALGAQFWFDLMKRLVDLRGSGVKPPPSGAPNDNTGTIPMPPAGFISDGDPPALA